MAGGFIARRPDGKCHAFGLPGLPGPTNDDVAIHAAVGRGGQTKGPDVLRIQRALNLVPGQLGGPSPTLPENSVAGQETIAAIEAFQRLHFFSSDGRIDVRGRTHLKISSLQPLKIRRMQSAEKFLRGALFRITAAQAALLAASAELLTGGGIVGRRNLDLVDKHFNVTKSKTPSTVLGRLCSTYGLMLTFFARPGGLWGWQAFEAEPFTTKNLGYTYSGGYYQGGRYQGGQRLDSIYLSSAWDNLPQSNDATQQLGTIIHELAHFVGPISPDAIIDYAYGSVTDPKMKALTPYQKQHNAETYMNFALDAP